MADKYINLDTMGTYMKQLKVKLAKKYVRKSHGHADIQENISNTLQTIIDPENKTGVADRAKALEEKLIKVEKTLLNANEANKLNALESDVQFILSSQSNNLAVESKDGEEYFTMRYNNDIESYYIKTNKLEVNKGDVIDLYKQVIDTTSMMPPNATSCPRITIDDSTVVDFVPNNFTLLSAKNSGVTDIIFSDCRNSNRVLRITVL